MDCQHCQEPVIAGHRFCGHCGKALTMPGHVTGGQLRARENDRAELRHLTIVFSDLADSVPLTARLGAERFRELLRDYRETSARVFVKHGGYVARYFGDGTLVYFGYPQAHEDNARRAVSAAMEVLAAMGEQRARLAADWNVDLQLRAAVHTGIVVVGDLSSETTGEPMAIVGDAPNVAARLQQLAEPGTVLISDATYALVRQDFTCACLGPLKLKGVPSPVTTYRVDALSPKQYDPRPSRGRLIGRDRETGVLSAAWLDALAGRGQAVLIRGEPGIGKSRLIAEVAIEAARDGACEVMLQCSPIYQNTALHPFIEYMSGLFKLRPGQTGAEQVARIEGVFASRDLDPADYAPLLASLLGVAPDGQPRPALSPVQEREAVKQRLGDWLLHIAALQPVLIVVEDLHWADPSSVELLSEILPRLAGSRVLIAMTCRDEFDAARLGPAPSTEIDLRRLDDAETMSLIQVVAQARVLPPATLELLGARTDGVPFYIEELTRTLVETELDADDEAQEAMAAMPATLSELLAARVDRVAVSRELLEFIAVLGRDFDLDLISAVWKRDAALLRAELDKLVGARLLRETGDAGRTRYTFHHALIQESIYQSILAARRRSVHAEIAAALVGAFQRVAEERPELLAHHYAGAGQHGAALPFLRLAATKAIRRSAHVEARRYLRAALEVADAEPPSPERERTQAELLLSLGVVLTASSGYASDKVGEVFARARALCRILDPAINLFPVLHGLYRFYYVRGELDSAAELSAEMLSIARGHDATDLLVEAHRAAGNCCFNRGRFDEAEWHFAQALMSYDPVGHHANRYVFGLDPFVGATSVRALNAWFRGERAHAVLYASAAVAAAERLDHPYSLAWSLSYAALLHSIMDDLDALRDCSERLLICAERHVFPFWRWTGLMSLGWWLHRSGQDRPRGIRMIRQGLDGWEDMGADSHRPYFMSLLARAQLSDGDSDGAAAVLDAAVELCEQVGDVWWLPQLHHLRASFLAESGASGKIERGPALSAVTIS